MDGKQFLEDEFLKEVATICASLLVLRMAESLPGLRAGGGTEERRDGQYRMKGWRGKGPHKVPSIPGSSSFSLSFSFIFSFTMTVIAIIILHIVIKPCDLADWLIEVLLGADAAEIWKPLLPVKSYGGCPKTTKPSPQHSLLPLLCFKFYS